MINVAIEILWLLIGVVILAGVVWVAIWVIEQFVTPIPEQIKKGIWIVVLLLVLIGLLTVLAGGSLRLPFARQ